ncbi:CSN-associated deubiquitinating enzyme Ubp12 [Xylographa bjoerkii]|nr:CSN-associated deubiquitinating enzyme Ubp12 [Xylographa bjoerkii]
MTDAIRFLIDTLTNALMPRNALLILFALLNATKLCRAGPTAPLETGSLPATVSQSLFGGGSATGSQSLSGSASVATSASPSASVSAGIDSLCFPSDAAGNPFVDAPCNQIANVSAICNYGDTDADGGTAEQSPADQQSCYCDPYGKGALFFEYLEGCFNCERLHGQPEEDGWYPIAWVTAQSSSYCAIPTPKAGLEDFLGNWSASSGIVVGTSTGGSNILGTSTQVSLYFTSTPLHVAVSATTTEATGSGSDISTPTAGKVSGTSSKVAVGSSTVTGSQPAERHSELPPLGQLTDITSSNKKRKLSKPDISEESSPPSDSHNRPGSQDHKPTSPSLPRPIPPHLLTQESLARRSPTPDISSTAASSPSGAYAGLTLESEARGGEGTGVDNSGYPDSTRLSASRSILGSIANQARSSSPAKRLRSEMEVQNIEDVDNTDGSSNFAVEPMSDAPMAEPAGHISENRHRREQSVDMLGAYDNGDVSGENGDDNMGDDAGEIPSTGAYLTPQSGVSLSSSSTTNSSTPGTTTISPREVHPQQINPRQVNPRGPLPLIDDQISKVTTLLWRELQDGQKGYVISMKWLDRVTARGSHTQMGGKQTKASIEGEIGPVDNSGMNMIIDPSSMSFKDEAGEAFIPLKPGLQMGVDFSILPTEAWELVMKWYGLAEGSPVITRYCHNTSTNETQTNIQYELNPPIFTLLKLPDRSDGDAPKSLREKDLPPVKILANRHEGYQVFLKRAKQTADIDMKTRVRVWRILSDLKLGSQAGMLTPAQSRSASPAPNIAVPIDPGRTLVVDLAVFLSLETGSQRELVDLKDETMNNNYNGKSNLNLVGLGQEGVLVLEEQIGGPAGGEWVSDAAGTLADRNGVPVSITRNGATTTSNNMLKPKANTSSGRTSPAPASGMMTRGRAQKNGRTRGTVGLGNLGNTCYMNSALQCVRSVEELTMYFLQDKWKEELNPRNPLAHNGEVAKAYASLLKELYNENSNSSFSPRNFKQIIGKYGPSFSGYGQQDSQEFLLFLLDGLQEDLNRIHKKPYIEKPDSTDEMVTNPVALRGMANKCWEIYKARNDSVVTDLFAGMYKSTVVCPVCDKVSIIFDPFNNLTLQLPIENLWSRTLFFFPLHDRPIRIDVDIDKNATFGALKESIAAKVNVDPRKMIIAEIYKCRFFKVFNDKTCINDERIAEADSIAIFELEDIPTNYPVPKKKKTKSKNVMSYNNSDEEEELPVGDSPLAEKMLVAVFNRITKDGSSRFQQKAVVGVPSYIIVTREEAKDEDSILRKVLAKVATMTTHPFLLEDATQSDEESETQQDSDTVLMTPDDADSSSDSKVQATSIHSEDGIVDISMKEAGDESQRTSRISYPPRPRTPHALPRVLQPGEFIPDDLRSLFVLKYFKGQEMIPTGWNALQEESKEYPTIHSRVPVPMAVKPKLSARDEFKRRFKNNGSSSSSEEDTDDPPPAVNSVSSLEAEEDYDSDGSDALPRVEELMNPKSRGISRFKKRSKPGNRAKLITYSNKGKRTGATRGNDDSSSGESGAHSGTDGGPLLGLGEALILDWTPEGYDLLFGRSDARDDSGIRGLPTWENIPKLPDPELEEKRQLRVSRKRNGVSLGDCLDEFGKAEILSENDAWFCPRCKEHRRASKKFELWKSPDILVIHLKRFSAQGRLRDKLDVKVDFPIEGLDLSSRVAEKEDGQSPIYDLFAVDNHYGGLGGGHYTAFAQNFYDKSWYEYNDSMSSRRNAKDVVTSAAYLLFYRRRSVKPLGGPYFEQIIHAANDPPQEDPVSQTPSRAESPSVSAGEGKRLDGFSRNGSSSASHGAEAAHQAGSGGLRDGMLTAARIKDNSDRSPPDYSHGLHDGEQTLESMEVDEPSVGGHHIADLQAPTWGFDNMTSGSEDNPMNDTLFEGSMHANSSTGATDDEDARSLRDFDPTETVQYGTPETRPLEDDEIPILTDGQDDVTEVRLPEDEGASFKLD